MAKKAKSENKERMTLISARARKLFDAATNMKWTDAIKKASTELKKEGKL